MRSAVQTHTREWEGQRERERDLENNGKYYMLEFKWISTRHANDNCFIVRNECDGQHHTSLSLLFQVYVSNFFSNRLILIKESLSRSLRLPLTLVWPTLHSNPWWLALARVFHVRKLKLVFIWHKIKLFPFFGSAVIVCWTDWLPAVQMMLLLLLFVVCLACLASFVFVFHLWISCLGYCTHEMNKTKLINVKNTKFLFQLRILCVEHGIHAADIYINQCCTFIIKIQSDKTTKKQTTLSTRFAPMRHSVSLN